MGGDLHQTSNFERQLRLEAERVLNDLIFKRSPIQSQLLRFLVDKTLASPVPPTQYEVAVDGLGRSADYELSSDSYPRVQISRLRKNLENYYEQNLPGEDLKIHIDTGSYRLSMVPAEPQYSPPEAPSEQRDYGGNGSSQRVETGRGSERSPMLVIALVLCAIMLAVSLFLNFRTATETGAATGPIKPTTAIDIEAAALVGTQSAPIIERASRLAEIQFSNSFVSKPLPLGSAVPDADYRLGLNFGLESDGTTALFLSLADRDGDILYSNSVLFEPENPAAFVNEIEASLVFMTSPTGIIAQAELPDMSLASSTDYACFLAIEGRRANGQAAAELVDRCVASYPDSDYISYWLARRAFTAYQADVVAGRAVARTGPGWEDLQRALDADPFNAFANFVAAKVELAEGRCFDAQIFVERALERGGSYPALIAAVETNAAACSFDDDSKARMIERVRVLTEYNPSPDPLLQLYMIIGSLAAEDRDLAERVARRSAFANPEGAIEQTIYLLQRGFEDRAFAVENSERIAQSISVFVWSAAATDNIVAALLDA